MNTHAHFQRIASTLAVIAALGCKGSIGFDAKKEGTSNRTSAAAPAPAPEPTPNPAPAPTPTPASAPSPARPKYGMNLNGFVPAGTAYVTAIRIEADGYSALGQNQPLANGTFALAIEAEDTSRHFVLVTAYASNDTILAQTITIFDAVALQLAETSVPFSTAETVQSALLLARHQTTPIPLNDTSFRVKGDVDTLLATMPSLKDTPQAALAIAAREVDLDFLLPATPRATPLVSPPARMAPATLVSLKVDASDPNATGAISFTVKARFAGIDADFVMPPDLFDIKTVPISTTNVRGNASNSTTVTSDGAYLVVASWYDQVTGESARVTRVTVTDSVYLHQDASGRAAGYVYDDVDTASGSQFGVVGKNVFGTLAAAVAAAPANGDVIITPGTYAAATPVTTSRRLTLHGSVELTGSMTLADVAVGVWTLTLAGTIADADFTGTGTVRSKSGTPLTLNDATTSAGLALSLVNDGDTIADATLAGSVRAVTGAKLTMREVLLTGDMRVESNASVTWDSGSFTVRGGRMQIGGSFGAAPGHLGTFLADSGACVGVSNFTYPEGAFLSEDSTYIVSGVGSTVKNDGTMGGSEDLQVQNSARYHGSGFISGVLTTSGGVFSPGSDGVCLAL